MSTVTHINPPELHTNPAFSQGTLVEAGTYAVCPRCYKRQWDDVYGEQFGGIKYDEYLKRQAAGEAGF